MFDLPDFRPYLGYIRRIAVTYGTRDATGAPGTTNVVKPLYHVAWLASRLGMRVVSPLTPVEPRTGRPAPGPASGRRCTAGCRRSSATTGRVGVVIRPISSSMAGGTTLRVEILAERRGSELRADVTAEAENVHCHTWLDGIQFMDRTFRAPRRNDATC